MVIDSKDYLKCGAFLSHWFRFWFGFVSSQSKQGISSFLSFRLARALVAGLELATEGSLQILGWAFGYPLCHQRPVAAVIFVMWITSHRITVLHGAMGNNNVLTSCTYATNSESAEGKDVLYNQTQSTDLSLNQSINHRQRGKQTRILFSSYNGNFGDDKLLKYCQNRNQPTSTQHIVEEPMPEVDGCQIVSGRLDVYHRPHDYEDLPSSERVLVHLFAQNLHSVVCIHKAF
ncbi:hypothetical protein PoB_001889000 [Plakobranchus ocellatus]|uniref:Uncharacterized protein n=1 Tax=Plakobranchus ocellatus TaxID=259542 RepID=A0AAV3ZB49_9GAST|nr:hypothetical protein PoB_001889000 [Plakobranchus ocellatus]